MSVKHLRHGLVAATTSAAALLFATFFATSAWAGTDAGPPDAMPDAAPDAAVDASHPADAGHPVDAAKPKDTGASTDVGPPADSGSTVDSPAPHDSGVMPGMDATVTHVDATVGNDGDTKSIVVDAAPTNDLGASAPTLDATAADFGDAGGDDAGPPPDFNAGCATATGSGDTGAMLFGFGTITGALVMASRRRRRR